MTSSAGAVVSRHDYQPFGIELDTTTSGRATGLGYGATDGVRDKFTGYERDTETGLDFPQARYYSSAQGRFTTADPLASSADTTNPQSFNRYSYSLNSPTTLTDPSGLSAIDSAYRNDGAVGGVGGAFSSADMGASLFDTQFPTFLSESQIAAFQLMFAISAGARPQNSNNECGCALQVRGNSGSRLAPDNPLKFPGRKQTLGPASLPYNWGYQIEERASVPDDIRLGLLRELVPV